MKTKVLLAALAGAVVTFLIGYLIWGLSLQGFMNNNTTDVAGAIGGGVIGWVLGYGNTK